MKWWGWWLIGLVCGLAGAGLWYSQARATWLLQAQAATVRADAAEQAHDEAQRLADDRLRLVHRLEVAADSAIDRARVSAALAGTARHRADALTDNLAVVATVRDSVAVLVARDSVRVEQLAHVEAQATSWRVAFELVRARGDSLALVVDSLSGDAARLSQANADLRRQIQTAVPPVSRGTWLGLPLPSRTTTFLLGVVAGVWIGARL